MEWTNARNGGGHRASRCVAQLVEQTRKCLALFDGRAELLIVFDPTRVGEVSIRAALGVAGDPTGWPMNLRLVTIRGRAGYLDFKNLGFAHSTAGIVVFLDCDVIPEPNWLRCLLSPLGNPNIAVVTGSTYIDGDGWVDRAVALFWFFPPRSVNEVLRPTNFILPNNVAYRRSVYARFPFEGHGSSRGNAAENARRIWEAGLGVMQHSGARCAHPAPVRTLMVRRALIQGHDFAVLERRPGYGPPLRCFASTLRHAAMRILGRRRALDAGWGSVAFSFTVALFYYGIVLGAHLIGRTAPRLMYRYGPT
jgi:glycosyltransferase involved in cell wall biosynthesis